MNAEKAALRRATLDKIDGLSADYIANSDRGIFENLVKLPEFVAAQVIFTYYSVNREPDTRQIVEYALAAGKTVALPVCAKCGVMDARAISNTCELVPSAFELLEPKGSTRVIEPEDLEFVIVPALSYDLEGFRLGYGGGYYDRFLLKTRAFTAGLAREQLLMARVPREDHDVGVCCVVTEKGARPQKESR